MIFYFPHLAQRRRVVLVAGNAADCPLIASDHHTHIIIIIWSPISYIFVQRFKRNDEIQLLWWQRKLIKKVKTCKLKSQGISTFRAAFHYCRGEFLWWSNVAKHWNFVERRKHWNKSKTKIETKQNKNVAKHWNFVEKRKHWNKSKTKNKTNIERKQNKKSGKTLKLCGEKKTLKQNKTKIEKKKNKKRGKTLKLCGEKKTLKQNKQNKTKKVAKHWNLVKRRLQMFLRWAFSGRACQGYYMTTTAS